MCLHWRCHGDKGCIVHRAHGGQQNHTHNFLHHLCEGVKQLTAGKGLDSRQWVCAVNTSMGRNNLLLNTYDLLKKFGIDKAKPIKTPMGTNDHLDLDMTVKSIDQKVYHSMIGSLLYLYASRLNIMLSVCMCARF
jgi:hypothetical protein